MRLCIVSVLVAGVWLLAGNLGVHAGQDKSVNDGVYSEAQAACGQAAFDKNCTTCHDTARFTGAEFVQSWSAKPLAELYVIMRTTMPEDNPGLLRPQQYADILSFFLKLNGFAAGEAELTGNDAAMKAIRMEAPPSPGQN